MNISNLRFRKWGFPEKKNIPYLQVDSRKARRLAVGIMNKRGAVSTEDVLRVLICGDLPPNYIQLYPNQVSTVAGTLGQMYRGKRWVRVNGHYELPSPDNSVEVNGHGNERINLPLIPMEMPIEPAEVPSTPPDNKTEPSRPENGSRKSSFRNGVKEREPLEDPITARIKEIKSRRPVDETGVIIAKLRKYSPVIEGLYERGRAENAGVIRYGGGGGRKGISNLKHDLRVVLDHYMADGQHPKFGHYRTKRVRLGLVLSEETRRAFRRFSDYHGLYQSKAGIS